MKRFVVLRALAALAVFMFVTAMTRSAQAASAQEPAANAARTREEQAKPFVAQVVGLIWLNPLQRRDYPTEWQLLWTQGLAAPNKNDDMIRTDPKSFTTLQSVAGIAYGNQGKETFRGFYRKYISELPLLLRSRYASNPKYFYTVSPVNKKGWRELAGIRVELAIPDRLEPDESQSYLRDSIRKAFSIGNPHFSTMWSRDTLPDVQIAQGGANAGFTSLNRALDYLQANPDKTVWVVNWDAPNFPPTDAQINENLVALFLAGPTSTPSVNRSHGSARPQPATRRRLRGKSAPPAPCKRGRRPSTKQPATPASRFQTSSTSFTTQARAVMRRRHALPPSRKR